MALDFLAFKQIVSLLKKELLNGKISKISQISNEEFLFEIRNNGKNFLMLISTHPLMPYINLIQKKPMSVSVHTNLVLLLRKHLENGKIVNMNQENDDRIVSFEILSRDDYYQNTIKKLYVELIGRASNLILTNKDETILDCLKKIPVQYNNLRTLLPNIKYTLPDKPLTQKLPFSIENELQYRRCTIDELTKIIDSSDKIYITEKENKKDFHFFPFYNMEGKFEEYNWNDGIEAFYNSTLNAERKRQNISYIEKILKQELKKARRKIDKLNQDMNNALSSEEFKYFGDVLLTYAQDVKLVTNPLVVFDESMNKNVSIPMDIRYSVFKNASLLYKKYQKSKIAKQKVQEQIDIATNNVDYLESVYFHLLNSDVINLKEIEEELVLQGIIKTKQKVVSHKKSSKKVEKVYRPKKYKCEDVVISVGENNLQNEYLTFKIANKNHYYFHVQKFHGAHVIVHSDVLNEKLIRAAANLAALHSEAKDSSTVAIDYTQVKNVKKIPGGKPGKVLINKQKTIYIDPDKDLIKNLNKLS